MRFDTKIAIVVRDDLATWQKLNVACFLSGGLVGTYPEIVGQRYGDAEGRLYGPLIRQPIMVYSATGDGLAQALRRARERGISPSIYTSALFSTTNDRDNRAAVAAVREADFDLVGLGLHADRRDIDKVVKGLPLHP